MDEQYPEGVSQRGRKAMRTEITTPPIWGTLYPPDPKYWQGKITLMEKDGWGQRYIANDEVPGKLAKGWRKVEVIDPTKPAAPQPEFTDAAIEASQPVEAQGKPMKPPRMRPRKK
jgi:hypothetical protein